jgi:hypothetical protein
LKAYWKTLDLLTWTQNMTKLEMSMLEISGSPKSVVKPVVLTYLKTSQKFEPVLWIRIRIRIRRIRMFLNLPIQICHYLLGSGSFYVNLPLKSNKQKKTKKKIDFLLASWRSLTKRAKSGSAESGSVSQWYGSGPASVQMSGKHNTDLVRTTVPVPGPPMFIVQGSWHTSRATLWIRNDFFRFQIDV